MLAFSARRFVWEEIFLISSVSSLILPTALDCSMATWLFWRMVSYMDSALSLEAVVVSRSCLARERTSFDAVCPSSDKDRMESASSLIVFTFPEIMVVLAVVSCIPAASSWVVAELSSEAALFSCIIKSSLFTLVRIVDSTSSMRFIISRRTPRISLTAFAITPVSSFCFSRFALPSVFRKSSCEVC